MNTNAETDLIDLVAMMNRVLRNKLVLVITGLFTFALVVAYAFFAAPYYQSITKMVYQSSAKSAGGLAALASIAGVSMNSGNEDASSYLSDIVYSKNLLSLLLDRGWRVSCVNSDTVNTIFLDSLWNFSTDTTKEHWRSYKQEVLLNKLIDGKYIRFSQDKKSGVISLITEFEDPRVAYDINVFLYQELNNTLVNKMSFKAAANRKFIEERLSEVKQDLAKAENNLKHYRERNRLRLDPSDQLEDSRLQREVLINQEVMIQLQKQYEMAKIEEAKDLPVLDIIDSPRMPVEKSKPQRKKFVLIGLVLGFMIGIISALLYDVCKCMRN